MKSRFYAILIALFATISLYAQLSGTCGDSVTWVINKRDSTMTISGTGPMTNYDSFNNRVPWEYNRREFSKVIIEDGVTNIGDYAFSQCLDVRSVIIPQSVTRIGVSAFSMGYYTNTALESIDIPNSVDTIGACAFENCHSLKSLIIPENVSYIGRRAFAYCLELYSVTFKSPIVPFFGNGVFESSYHIKCYVPCGSKQQYYTTLLSTETNTHVASILSDSTFNEVLDYTYEFRSNNTSKGSIDIIQPPTCEDSSVIVFANANNEFEFSHWSDEEVINPRTIKLTQDTSLIAFFKVSGMCGDSLNWSLVDSILSISGSGPMYNFERFDSVPWYQYRYEIDSVILAEGITSIGDYAFMWCPFRTLIIPEGVTTIGHQSICACKNLNVISLPNSLEFVGEDNFASCNSLPIDNNMRYADTYLVEYLGGQIKNGTKFIGYYAYKANNAITSVNIPDGVEYIECAAFGGCSKLSSITLPNSIRRIKASAFSGTKISSIYIPDSVDIIENQVFAECNMLTSLVIPSHVKTVGEYSFSYCNRLQSVVIEEGVENIKESAFAYCTALNVVKIPESVNHLGNSVFKSCGNLSQLYINSIQPIEADSNQNIYYNLISDNNNNIPTNLSIYVPCGSMEDYKTAPVWNRYSEKIKYAPIPFEVNGNPAVAGTGNVMFAYPQTMCDSTLVYANSSFGYHFARWIDGPTQQYRKVFITSDTTFTAVFEKDTFLIITESNDTTMGTTNGNHFAPYKEKVKVEAFPKYGYKFIRWDDGVYYTNPRSFLVNGNQTLVAYFDYDNFYITANVDDVSHGSCIGSGYYRYLSEGTITANPTYGYHFDHWSDRDRTNPRTVTILKDSTFTACFAPNKYTLTLGSADPNKGYAIGGGTYEYGTTASIRAIPSEHYHFSHWSDGNNENPRDIIITGDNALEAYFAIDQHTVTITTNDIVRGMVSSSGTLFDYGTACTVIATPYTGYKFVKWSNDITANPYIFAVLNDISLVAIFEAEASNANIIEKSVPNVYTRNMQIFVKNVMGRQVSLYDIDGRLISQRHGENMICFEVLSAGVYIIQIGDLYRQKVIVSY